MEQGITTATNSVYIMPCSLHSDVCRSSVYRVPSYRIGSRRLTLNDRIRELIDDRGLRLNSKGFIVRGTSSTPVSEHIGKDHEFCFDLYDTETHQLIEVPTWRATNYLLDKRGD